MKILFVMIALWGVGCVSGGKPASAECEDTNECDDGLECLPFAVFEQNVCREVADVCTTTCLTNADCAPLGPTFMCFATCDETMTCADTASP